MTTSCSSKGKVLVTGASGYVAGHVVKLLLESGYAVRGTVRSLKDRDKFKHLYCVCPEAQHNLELVEADLLHEESWQPAVDGMDFVIHVASPVIIHASHEDELLKPAVGGTLSVLRACAKVPSVKRVVMTSSVVAVGWHLDLSKTPATEADWSDITKLSLYPKSKTLAERSAWEFVKELPDSNKFELAVINPSFVLGPALHDSSNFGVEMLRNLLTRQRLAFPPMNFSMVDVRDVALAHVRALTVPEAAGHRHLCTADNMWFSEMAFLLKFVFDKQGYNVPTYIIPMWLLRVFSLFTKTLRDHLKDMDVVHRFDNTRMRQVLKIEPRNVRTAIIEMAYSLIELGAVKKTSQYKGPGGPEERLGYLSLKLST